MPGSNRAIGSGPTRNVVLNSGEHKILSEILDGRTFHYEGREIGNYTIGAKMIYNSESTEEEPVQVMAGTGSLPTCPITKRVFTKHQKIWPLLKGHASIIKYRKVPNSNNIPGLGSDYYNWGYNQNETKEKIGCVVLDHESFVYMFHTKSPLKHALHAASSILRKEWNSHLVSAQGGRSDQKIIWSEGMFSWNGEGKTLWSKIRVSVNTYRFSRQVSDNQYAEITPEDVDVSIKMASSGIKRPVIVGETCDEDGLTWDMYGLIMPVTEMISMIENNDFKEFMNELIEKNPKIQEKVNNNFTALRMSPHVPFPGSLRKMNENRNSRKRPPLVIKVTKKKAVEKKIGKEGIKKSFENMDKGRPFKKVGKKKKSSPVNYETDEDDEDYYINPNEQNQATQEGKSGSASEEEESVQG